MRKIPTAVLISGRGSNMMALAEAARADDFPAKIILVASNNPEALGLQRAADLTIPVAAMDHNSFDSRESFDRELDRVLKKSGAELICCAGFMRILSPWFVKRWPNQIINIHPSLLPKYKGLNTHQRAIDAGDDFHGCSVHFVNEELDGGSIILQDKVDISESDTAETLSEKVLKLEHPLYVKALRKVANQRQNMV